MHIVSAAVPLTTEAVLYEVSPSSKRSLSLQEKQEKTPGFIECSPRGLVPAIKYNDDNVYESLPGLEYVEEV